jgi:hypothetical protein
MNIEKSNYRENMSEDEYYKENHNYFPGCAHRIIPKLPRSLKLIHFIYTKNNEITLVCYIAYIMQNTYVSKYILHTI